MPVSIKINGDRKDDDWDVFQLRLTPAQRDSAAKSLLTDWPDASSACLASLDKFVDFLALRYRKVVGRALRNIGGPEWETLTSSEQDAALSMIALHR